MFYGYIRAGAPSQTSTKNSLEDQKTGLKNAGAEKIYSDSFKGSVNDHPHLDKKEKLIFFIEFGLPDYRFRSSYLY